MDPNDHADALSLLADAALSDEPHEATWDAPRGLDMRTANALEDAAPASTGAASPPASPGDAANREEGVAFGRAPRSSSPVTIDSERATVVPVGTYYAQVIEECLERLAMLARHRDERPSRARREIEARILAQVDAIVEARATVGDLIAFWDREVDDDPWSAWAVTFTLGCLEGREPVAAIRDLCEALPDDGARAALVVVDALVASPHGARGVLGRELVRSSSPLARAVGIELLSRMGQLAHEIELAALDQEHPEVQAAGVRAVTRRETAGAAMAGLRAGLHSEHACVVREAARALALFGQDDGLEELRGGDQLANMLGEGALEPFVLRGDLDDIGVMQRIARWLPASAGSLSAVGRFGHPAAWAYLLHGLSQAELAEGAQRALVTLFGPLVAAERQKDPAAWRRALEAADVPQGARLRCGVPWSARVVLAECASGELPRREIEFRHDELRARTGRLTNADLAAWGSPGAASRGDAG